MSAGKKRVLIFIPAYHAETTICSVIRRIPAALCERYELDGLIIDDASRDATFARGYEESRRGGLPFKVRVLLNPVNQGYGGNQKLGYRYAIDNGYDLVAMVHGDGQYAPECLPTLLEPFDGGALGAVFGSRMLSALGALRGGMPLYKFAGNRILTCIQNGLLGSTLSEFHSGYRVYSVRALQAIPFERNSNDFHFDTEIIIQLLLAKLEIRELPIPTFYGDEICRVNGLAYALNVIVATLKSRMQQFGLFYDRRYDCVPRDPDQYQSKLAYTSPDSMVLDVVPEGSRVLDLGSIENEVPQALQKQKQCVVSQLDVRKSGHLTPDAFWDKLYPQTVGRGLSGVPTRHDFVLCLDVLEHLERPEQFLDDLHRHLSHSPETELLITTANVAFFIPRLMLLLGQFNYGRRGILDSTHTRLFTFGSFGHLLKQAGFEVCDIKGVPAPFPLAIKDNRWSRHLLRVNTLLIRVSRGLFAYQIFVRARALPSVPYLLNATFEESRKRVEAIHEAA